MGLPVLSVPEENACGCVDRNDDDGRECICSTTGLVQIQLEFADIHLRTFQF
ncbi:MAG: hypothetical protein LC754_07985 [Acidobacteria bacterium]|nr:hypothetical protein [Acidobacteriota bacterium]